MYYISKYLSVRLTVFSILFTALSFCSSSVLSAEPKAEKKQETLAAAALWDKFSSHLRNGEMQSAYLCFTQRSRALMSFNDFCAQYHPVTAACEAILGNITDTRLNVSDNKAIITFVSTPAGDQKNPTIISAYMVKEFDLWLLVIESDWAAASAEADGKLLLTEIHKIFSRHHIEKKLKQSANSFHTENKEFISGPLFKNIEQIYYIKIKIIKLNNWKITIVPKDKKSGLKSFSINNNGYITEVDHK
ncbi:MAG: hypothetical protein ACYTFY_15950 [Planctomycetota bacterium]|jgi:hypothetical protein